MLNPTAQKSNNSSHNFLTEYELKDYSHYLQAEDAEQRLLAFQAPRACNTGAQTEPLPRSHKIDWLEFTVKQSTPAYAIKEYLGLDPDIFQAMPYGMQGYTDCVAYGSIKVLNSPAKPDRGTKVILSATALDQVALDGLITIKRVLRDGGTFARIDLALDDRTGSLNVSTFLEAENHGNSVCHFKEVQPVERFTRAAGGLHRCAHGLNYGSRTSQRYIRIYDKRLEQLNQNKADPGTWLRFEMQCNKRSALVTAMHIAAHGLESIPGLVAGCVDYRETSRTETKNNRRLGWWAEFINHCQPVKTGFQKLPQTVETKFQWLAQQVKKTLGQVCVALSSDYIADLIHTGIEKTTLKEWALLLPDRNVETLYFDVRRGLAPVPF